jgi:hypothetical protein
LRDACRIFRGYLRGAELVLLQCRVERSCQAVCETKQSVEIQGKTLILLMILQNKNANK